MNQNSVKKVLFCIGLGLLCLNLCCAYCEEDVSRFDHQYNQIEKQRSHAKNEIHKLLKLEKIETNKLYRNQQKLEHAQYSLEKNQREYTNAKSEVESLEKKLDVVMAEHRKLQQYAAKRIVQIFKHKRNSYIEFLLNAQDINAFLDRLYFENIIIAHDRKKLRESKKSAREVLALKARIEMQTKNLQYSIVNIKKQQVYVQDAISKNEKLIEKLQTDRSTWEKAEKDLARQSKAISSMINQEIKKTQKEGVNVVVTSGFVRPVGGRITSEFGYRMHPIFKKRIFHSGVDIGVPYGTPIKAANSGRVMFVGWYSGYGKVVIIDHGKIGGVPTTTLYAHMSVTLAKQGTNVAKGAIIGKVGTTGYSTGPHLHFEVRQNGNPTNPLRFIK